MIDDMTKEEYRKSFSPISKRFLKKNSICERCGRPATQSHHVVALIDGGTNDFENLSALCTECHREWEIYEHAAFEYDFFLETPSIFAIAFVIKNDINLDFFFDLHDAERKINEMKERR